MATVFLGRNPSGFEFAPRLWLSLGSFYFQPSEPMKFVLVAFVVSYLAEQAHQICERRDHARGEIRAVASAARSNGAYVAARYGHLGVAA